MKRTLITALIASLTGVGGYYIGKHDLFSSLSLASMKSNSSQSETADQKRLAFSAKCVVQITPYKQGSLGTTGSNNMILRTIFQTEFNTIKGKETIERAIQDYKLDKLTTVDAEQLANLISSTLKTSQERGTDLIVIEAFGKTEDQAQQILYAVATSYDTKRKEAIQSIRTEVIKKFQQKMQAQEDRVEAQREKLYQLSKKLGIPYEGINPPPTTTYLDENPSETKQKALISAEEHTQFGKVKDDYEREFHILQAIKDAEFRETITAGLDYDPIRYHQYGWTPEVKTFMDARKKE